MNKRPTKIIAILLCILLAIQQTGFAQAAAVELNIAGYFVHAHNALASDVFRPAHLLYLSYDTQNNNFKLLLDKGDFAAASSLRGSAIGADEAISSEAKQLLKYFFIGLSLPNDAFWVNLRPDSPDNIIDSYLAQTDIGRIMLESDLQLKKDTARATSPNTPEGKDYWNKLYQKAQELFGQENITI
ncbi:MAG: hypothetical protein NTY47_00435, partial [Candidatus Omnitrophica bacterium]|nr:hypothetical protein [Candidatus Omnitrophota bacterium]